MHLVLAPLQTPCIHREEDVERLVCSWRPAPHTMSLLATILLWNFNVHCYEQNQELLIMPQWTCN